MYELACLCIPPGETWEDEQHVEHCKYWIDGALFAVAYPDFAHHGTPSELLSAVTEVRNVLAESTGEWIADPNESPLPLVCEDV